jgi:hypothetical protein
LFNTQPEEVFLANRFRPLETPVTRGAHERDVAVQFSVSVDEVRAIPRRTAVEVIGVEGVERERFKMLDGLTGLRRSSLRGRPPATTRARSLWTAYDRSGR